MICRGKAASPPFDSAARPFSKNDVGKQPAKPDRQAELRSMLDDLFPTAGESSQVKLAAVFSVDP